MANEKRVNIEELKEAITTALPNAVVEILREPHTRTYWTGDGEVVEGLGYEIKVSNVDESGQTLAEFIALSHDPEKTTGELANENRISAKYSDLDQSSVIKEILSRLAALEGK